MWAIIIMITVINIIIIWMTLRSLVWGLGSDTQRGVSVQNFTFEDLSMFIFSLHLFTHFLSQGILFVDQRVKGRNYCFLGWFCPALCRARVISPLQFLCSLPQFWCALLPYVWVFLGSLFSGYCFACPGRLLEMPWYLPLPTPSTPPAHALGPLLASDGQVWEYEEPPLCLSWDYSEN